jgi:hypothetical protein
MVLSLDADLARELTSSHAKPVWLLELQLKAGPGAAYAGAEIYNSLKFCSGDRPLRDTTYDEDDVYRGQKVIPNILVEVGELSQEVDAIERSCSISNSSAVLIDDGTLRDILDDPGVNMSSYGGDQQLYGQKVILRLGTQDIDVNKFATIGTYYISEILPRQGSIELSLDAVTVLTSERLLRRNFIARSIHEQLFEVLRHGAGLTDVQFDATALDVEYNNAAPTTDIDTRHLMCARMKVHYGDYIDTDKAPNNENVLAILSGLPYITGGAVVAREDGKVTYIPWDASAATVRSLGGDDVRDFSQEVAYANTINRITHRIADQVQKTSYDPYPGNYAGPLSAGPKTQNAYFGGIDGDATHTTESVSSAQAFASVDSNNTDSLSDNFRKRWFAVDKDLVWESGMAACVMLGAREITGSGYIDPYNRTYGNYLSGGEYTHFTDASTSTYYPYTGGVPFGVIAPPNPPNALRAGYVDLFNGERVNTTDTTKEDYVDVTRGMVIRCTPKLPAEQTQAVTDACCYKEGRIIDITMEASGGGSRIFVAFDQVLEFTGNWGKTISGGISWTIYDPEYPAGVRTLGTAGRGDPRGAPTSSREYNQVQAPPPTPTSSTPQFQGYAALDLARYYYVQYAPHMGFAGCNWDITLSPPGYAGPGSGYQSPANQAPFTTDNANLRRVFGHGTATGYAQLRSSEWVTNQTLAGVTYAEPGVANSGYILLEQDAQSLSSSSGTTLGPTGYRKEIVQCNLSYPVSGWTVTGTATAATMGSGRYVHKWSKPPDEPDSTYFSPTPRARGNGMATCAAFRVDASSCTFDDLGFIPDISSWPGGSTAATWVGGSIGLPRGPAIVPSGRGALDTTSSLDDTRMLWGPSAVYLPVPGGSSATPTTPPNLFWVGIKATDITSAEHVAKRILDRCSEGMPIVKVRTGLEHIDLQLGDFVSLTANVYLRAGKNGSDTSTVFEIVRKEIFLEEDSPGAEFILAFVRQGVASSVPVTHPNENGKKVGLELTVKSSQDTILLSLEGVAIYSNSGKTIYTDTGELG